MSQELMQMYIEETREHLQILDEALLNLEKNIEDTSLINEIFRIAHTIKGASGAMGFEKIRKLTHDMEDVLDDMRKGKLELEPKVIQLLFICHDFLENSLESIERLGTEEEIENESLLGKLHEIIEKKSVQQLSKKAIEFEDKKTLLDDYELTADEIEILDSNTSNGEFIYEIDIQINNDCQYKNVSIWMAIKELDELGRVIRMEPEKMEDSEYLKEDFSFERDNIRTIIVSRFNKEEISKKLQKFKDVESFCVETLEKEKKLFEEEKLKLVSSKGGFCSNINLKDSTEIMVDEIIGESEETIIKIEHEFSSDVISSIQKQIEKINMQVVILEDEQDNKSVLYLLLRCFHTIKGLAKFIGYNEIYDISDKTEEYLNNIYKNSEDVNKKAVDKILESSSLIWELTENFYIANDLEFKEKLKKYLEFYNKKEKLEEKKIGEILVEEGKLDTKDVEEILIKQKDEYVNLKFGQVAVKEKKVHPSDVVDSIRNQSSFYNGGEKKNKAENLFMKIPVEKIDNLVDLLGELMVFYSIIERDAREEMDVHSNFINNLSRMSKTIKDIQGLSMSLRMVSIRPTIQKLVRIARDTSVELNKDVDIVINGENTEVDRSLVEKLFDPLMHIVRNAVSHGIESKEERLQSGKRAEGTVTINAFSKRGNVYIEVKDDGKGLDTKKIYAKALEKGLINPDKDYTEDEITRFILLPGFSTAEEVNNISGRGVGMNVVETELSKMSAKLEIFNDLGRGCKFVLKIPINLAVINGTIVKIDDKKYIIPTLYINHLFKPIEEDWVSVKGKRNLIKFRDEIISLIPLEKILGSSFDIKMIIILEVDQKLKALPITEIIGRQEVVAKPIGNEFKNLKFISGASILGDGKVSLILDVEALLKME